MKLILIILFIVTVIHPSLIRAESRSSDELLQVIVSSAQREDFQVAALKLEELIKQKDSQETVIHSYRRLLSYFYFQQSEYQRALDSLNQIFIDRSDRAPVNSRDNSQLINRDRLFQWYLLNLLGEKREGDKLLVNILEQSTAKGLVCYNEFVEFLLGMIGRQELILKNDENLRRCNNLGEASQALAYFWIGVQADLQGDPKDRDDFLRLFLKNSKSVDIIERGIAFKILKIAPQYRNSLIEDKKGRDKDCYCAMSVE